MLFRYFGQYNAKVMTIQMLKVAQNCTIFENFTGRLNISPFHEPSRSL